MTSNYQSIGRTGDLGNCLPGRLTSTGHAPTLVSGYAMDVSARGDETVAKRTLRQLRQERLLSQVQLAHELGTTPATIFRIETGRSSPRISLRRAICDF